MHSAQNCIQTYFFKDLAEAKGQPAINLKGIFFLSSPLDLIKSWHVFPCHSPCLSPHHRAAVTHKELSLSHEQEWPGKGQCGGREMHWKTGKEKGEHQHSVQGTDAFFRAVLIPALKASLSQCFPHLQALQILVSGGLSPFASVPTLAHSRCCLCGLWNSHGLVATSREGK